LRIVTSDAFATEKLATMEAFGAELDVVHSPEGITPTLIPTLRARAAELVGELDAYATDQFRNHDMVTGYRRMGEEIAEQVGHVDAVCLYVGTAGCFLGVSGSLAERFPDLLKVVVEPSESPVLSGGQPGTHRIEGGGTGFRPEQLAEGSFDEVVTVSTEEAFEMARRLTRVEGVFSGPSTGANVVASLALARRLGRGHSIVTAQVDSGLKYLSGALYRDS
jgi:cysteine synthase A